MKYSIDNAIEYSNRNEIDKWLQLFLRDSSYEHASPNIPLADGLLLEERFYIGPVLIDLDIITTLRIEKDIENENDRQFYREKENGILEKYSDYNMPPLIAEYKNGKFNLVDGNHRYTALKKLNVDKYYVIIWGNKDLENEVKSIINKEGNYGNKTI